MTTAHPVPEPMQIDTGSIGILLERLGQIQNREAFAVTYSPEPPLWIKEVSDTELLLQDPTTRGVRGILIPITQGDDHKSCPLCCNFLVHQGQKILGDAPGFLPDVVRRLSVDNFVQAHLVQSSAPCENLAIVRPPKTIEFLPTRLETAKHARMFQGSVVNGRNGSLSGLVPLEETAV